MLNLPLFLYFLNALIFTNGDNALVILKNDEEAPIPSILVAMNGTNLTLTCKTIDPDDSKLVWHIPIQKFPNKNRKHFGFGNGIESEPAKLSFVPVQLHDRGTYFCIDATKSKLRTRLNLIVKSDIGEVRRRKRAQFGSGYHYPPGLPTPRPDMPALNIPNPARDFIYGRNRKPEPPLSENSGGYYGSWNRYSFDTSNIHSNNYYPNSGGGQDYLHNWNSGNSYNNLENSYNNYPKFEDSFTKTGITTITMAERKDNNNIWYFIAAMGGLIFISFLLWLATKDTVNRNIALQREARAAAVSRNAPTRNNGYNSVPASGSLLERPPMPIPPDTRGDVDTNILTYLILPTAPMSRIVEDDSPLPPSYDTSVQNSNIDGAPPSYDQAVANAPDSPRVVSTRAPLASSNNI